MYMISACLLTFRPILEKAYSTCFGRNKTPSGQRLVYSHPQRQQNMVNTPYNTRAGEGRKFHELKDMNSIDSMTRDGSMTLAATDTNYSKEARSGFY